jgi:predicted transglutaminase-like cysteine proteinase
MKKLLLGVFISAALVVPATFGQVAKERAADQKARIKQGQASGELTDKEAAKLKHGERKVNRDIKKAKADGVITPGEKAKVTAEQNKMSRKIAKQKHDAQTK